MVTTVTHIQCSSGVVYCNSNRTIQCILELNRLRQLYRPDLPLYDVPAERLVKCRETSQIQ